ncbi:site-specific integrase [Achromobacter deleyi]|uniref:site-specific integrase n=1 Tax=Achromobacter deleyi TaxID=1353891 RepID=UPI0014915F9C|nr:site-specific integrase [Achromobacter deleyi]QVQ29635.1 site-specific integrase [Achromobacter deleyi]UIP23820.1 site-specific integrase [Achromobacter deleyi]
MPLKLLASLPLLDPQTLDTQADAAVRGLLREGSSANTAASYRAAIRYWTAWFELRYGQPFALPLPEAAVIQFVVDHAQRSTDHGLKWELPLALDLELVRLKAKGKLGAPSLNTLLQRLSVLSKAHELLGHPNPCRNATIRELLAKTRRAYARRGAAPAKKEALTREPLQAMLETCDDSLRGKRDRALLLFAWASGGRRRSEVVRATMENTQRTAEGFLYSMTHSKTNQTGASRADDQKPIVGAAAQALEAWLAASEIRQGPIFRRVRRGDVIGEPLAAAAVRDIVLERCRQAGLEGEFSAHSLRSGFVTEAGRRNVPLGDTMAMTGHASVATVMGYFRAGAAARSPAARLLDDPPDPGL